MLGDELQPLIHWRHRPARASLASRKGCPDGRVSPILPEYSVTNQPGLYPAPPNETLQLPVAGFKEVVVAAALAGPVGRLHLPSQ